MDAKANTEQNQSDIDHEAGINREFLHVSFFFSFDKNNVHADEFDALST